MHDVPNVSRDTVPLRPCHGFSSLLLFLAFQNHVLTTDTVFDPEAQTRWEVTEDFVFLPIPPSMAERWAKIESAHTQEDLVRFG